MLFPYEGSNQDVRDWLYECLAGNLPRPLDMLELKTEIDKIEMSPIILIHSSVHLANQYLRNRRYAAYVVALLPCTPFNAKYRQEARELLVSFFSF